MVDRDNNLGRIIYELVSKIGESKENSTSFSLKLTEFVQVGLNNCLLLMDKIFII